MKILIESRNWNVPFTASVFCSIGFYVGFTLLIQQVYIFAPLISEASSFRTYIKSMSGMVNIKF